MKDIYSVFTYTFKEHMRKKAFIISTSILVVFAVLLFLIPAIIDKSTKNDKSMPQQNQTNFEGAEKIGNIFIIDKDNIFNNDFSAFSIMLPLYNYEIKKAEQEAYLKDNVKNNKDQFLLIITDNSGVPKIEYYFKDYMKGPNPSTINTIFKNMFETKLLKNINVPQEIINKLSTPIEVQQNEMGSGVIQRQIVCMLIMILLFFSIYYYGYWIAMSVASEKTSRVMEILITSTKPSSIIIGKTLAMGLLGLSQLMLILVTAITTYQTVFPKDFKVFDVPINFSSFTPFSMFMIIIYFVLGYFLYAMLNAVAGATVSKAEDVNSAIMPISMISLISFYFSYMPAIIPGATDLTVAASIIPFSAPFSMPARLLTSDVPFWQISLSLILLIISIRLFISISVRLYSSAVLHYGKRLNLSELIKLSRK